MKEPTRVGSFDDEMYSNYQTNQYSFGINEKAYKNNPGLVKLLEEMAMKEEQRIADSHDISKSNFGFK